MKVFGAVLVFAAGTVGLAHLPLKRLGVVMLVLATISAFALAWRKRGREVLAIGCFLAFSLVTEVLLEPLQGAAHFTWQWHTAAGVFLAQAAALLALALVVLAGLSWKRSLGVPALALGAALTVLVVAPRSVSWLYKAADIAAVAGVLVSTLRWWQRKAPLTILVAVTIMICSCAAVGAVAHATDYQDITTWTYQAAAMNAALLAATGLHLRAAFA